MRFPMALGIVLLPPIRLLPPHAVATTKFLGQKTEAVRLLKLRVCGATQKRILEENKPPRYAGLEGSVPVNCSTTLFLNENYFHFCQK